MRPSKDVLEVQLKYAIVLLRSSGPGEKNKTLPA